MSLLGALVVRFRKSMTSLGFLAIVIEVHLLNLCDITNFLNETGYEGLFTLW